MGQQEASKRYYEKVQLDPVRLAAKKLQEAKDRATYKTSTKGRLNHYQSQAERRGLSCDLTLDQIAAFWQVPCFYLNCSIDTVGLDRIDNTLGYTITNVVPCCYRCNVAR